MNNSSFAAQAVAEGPQTLAPPSFNGMGWLVVINLAVMTIWIGAGEIARREHRWILDAPVSSMTLAVAAGIVISRHPEPLSALMYGGGVGVLGEGVFKIAEQYIDKFKAVTGIGNKSAS